MNRAEWSARVGWLPPVVDRLAYDLVDGRGTSPANAVAESLATVRDLAKNGRTFDRDLRLKPDVLVMLSESLGEWEVLRAAAAAPKLPEGAEARMVSMLDLFEAKDSLAKASTPEPWSASKTSNWVARLGGLPDYIQHVSHGIRRSDPAISESEAIAKAIGVVKRWAAGGGGVDADTKAAAAKAVAEWEALKAKQAAKSGGKSAVRASAEMPIAAGFVAALLQESFGMSSPRAVGVTLTWLQRVVSGDVKGVSSEKRADVRAVLEAWTDGRVVSQALVKSVDRLQHVVTPLADQATFAARYGHRMSVIEGMLWSLGSRAHPGIALRSAQEFLGEQWFADDFDYSDPTMQSLAEAAQVDLSSQGRAKLAGKGHALPGGRYPIPNVEFLRKAIQAFGRAKNKDAVKAWIVKRAKALNATALLPDGWDIKESALYVTEALEQERMFCRVLMEALGYGTTPIRGRESGSKGKFHGMHGTERAVRKRAHLPNDGSAHPVVDAMQSGSKLTEAAPWTESLHPRAQGGRFGSKGGQPQGAHPSQSSPQVQQQLSERLSQLGYTGTGGLKEFQSTNGLPASGHLDDQTVAKLRSTNLEEQQSAQINASLAFGKAHPAGSQTIANKQLMASDQLQSIGYADDASGIGQFQKDYEIPVTGKLDETTLATIETVYVNNASASNAGVDFSGIKGHGVRTTSRRASTRGRTTVGKSIKEAVDSLVEDMDWTDGTTVAVYGGADGAVLPARVAPSRPEVDARPGDPDDVPGADDVDLDTPRGVPPGFGDGSPVRACGNCVHFARGGHAPGMKSYTGACMLWTYPAGRMNVCDDWDTLTPEDADVFMHEARVRDAERSGDTDRIVVERAKLREAREARSAVKTPLHPAHRNRAKLTPGQAKRRSA